MRNIVLRLVLFVCLSGASTLLVAQKAPGGGAACVMAKWQGVTLDYELVYGKSHPIQAQEEGERILKERGSGYYKNVDITHSQASSNLLHAFVTIIKTTYKTERGKERTSYGCGFSGRSKDDALWQAIRDLQAYSWGWKPDRDGYDIVKQIRY